jgi:amidophosphoribosyltransferase
VNEECAVFGVYGSEQAARMSYLGLYALQHRGQESTGIISSDGKNLYEFKGMGLVSKVFSEEALGGLKGHFAIGHNRYSTTGFSREANIQPLLVNCKLGKIAVAHNGNLVNASPLRKEMEMDGSIFRSAMDSEVILHLIARSQRETVEEMVEEALKKISGAYSLVFLLEDRIVAARDPHGFRPLCIGNLDDVIIVASESCAFDILGATFQREIEPGEMCVVDGGGIKSHRFASPAQPLSRCIFEFIYFSRPDSRVFGENVDKVRRKFGKKLARESPADADLVIAVPDSSNTIALGYSQESGIPFELGLIRNHYVGRTFIQPDQTIRDWDVRIKFNPVKGLLKGKKVVVVDDSIVRGSTMRKLVSIIRDSGTREIHLRIGSPPITHSCFYGIDTPTRQELIAYTHSVDEIRRYLEVESLRYLSLEGIMECVKDPNNYCYACFNGQYPVGNGKWIGKDVFEGNYGSDE